MKLRRPNYRVKAYYREDGTGSYAVQVRTCFFFWEGLDYGGWYNDLDSALKHARDCEGSRTVKTSVHYP